MHPICEHPSDLTIQSPGPVTNYLPLPLRVLRQRAGQGSLGRCVFHHPTRPNRKSSSAHCGCSWSKKRKFVAGLLPVRTGSRQVLTVAAAGPRRGGSSPVPTRTDRKSSSAHRGCSWSKKRRFAAGWERTSPPYPSERKPSSAQYGRQLLQEDDVGRWSGADFTAPTRPKREAVKCSLGLQLVQEIPTSGVSHELLDRIAAVVVETGPGLAIVPQLLVTATPRAAPTRGSRFAGPVCISPPYPSEQEVVKCSLRRFVAGLLPVRTGSRQVLTVAAAGPEEEIRRWLGAYFTTIPVRKEAVQRSLRAQLLQEDDVGRSTSKQSRWLTTWSVPAV